MSERPLNLRRSVQIVRRHKKTFSTLVVVGLAAGAAYVMIMPPVLTSSALVVVPQPVASASGGSSGNTGNTGSGASSGDASGFIDTQVVVATSDTVLTAAQPHISPAVSFQTLQADARAKSVTNSIMSITASGKTRTSAESQANAVANSYVAYVTKPGNPGGHVHAQILETATAATGLSLAERLAIFVPAGGAAGVLIGFLISFVMSSNSRKLVERDSIANSIGVPVLASIPVAHPSNAESWVKLLGNYEPGVVHAWALKRVLRQLGLTDAGAARRAVPSSLSVLSFVSDRGALALGPQLAVFAASQGIPTALVIGAHQDTAAIAALRTACAAQASASTGTVPPLRLIVAEDGRPDQRINGFTVIVTVIDGQEPRVPGTIRADATVIGVSAGGATADQLARAATSAAEDGRDILGILVADPDPGDQSTGRIPRLGPPARRQLPTQVKDMPTEVSR